MYHDGPRVARDQARTRSGHFHPQVLPRYQRREPIVNEALKAVFLLGVSTRQTGRALATLVQDAVSASTVSAVAKALDSSVLAFHRRRLSDRYRYLLLDGVSVRLRLVGRVQRRMVLCAYGVSLQGQRELIDFQLVKAEGEDTWYGFLWNLWSRGLRGEFLQLIVTDGQAGLTKALGRIWSAVAHHAVGLTNCGTWKTNSKPPSALVWRRPGSFTKPRIALRPSGASASGKLGGRLRPQKP